MFPSVQSLHINSLLFSEKGTPFPPPPQNKATQKTDKCKTKKTSNNNFLPSHHQLVCYYFIFGINIKQKRLTKVHYHIFCCNMLVFACPIIARSQFWLFALAYPYLPSNIHICPQIQLPVSAQCQWSLRLYIKVQENMAHKDMHKIAFQSN